MVAAVVADEHPDCRAGRDGVQKWLGLLPIDGHRLLYANRDPGVEAVDSVRHVQLLRLATITPLRSPRATRARWSERRVNAGSSSGTGRSRGERGVGDGHQACAVGPATNRLWRRPKVAARSGRVTSAEGRAGSSVSALRRPRILVRGAVASPAPTAIQWK